MKTKTAVFTLLVALLLAPLAKAEVQDGNQGLVKLEKDISFEDLLVQGKYQFSDEAVSTVEQDKVLDALLGVRTDFRDKIKQSASRN